MQMTGFKKALSLLLALVLIAAMALFTAGCNNDSKDVSSVPSEPTSSVASQQSNVLGNGKTAFTFKAVDATGKETVYTINTDKETVGAALLEHKLIAGEQGDYGLYVKTVNGITVDYDKDGKYWAFYIGDQYAPTGVDATAVTAGETYTFKVE